LKSSLEFVSQKWRKFVLAHCCCPSTGLLGVINENINRQAYYHIC